MKRFLALSLAICALVSITAAQSSEWKVFKPAGSIFSVKLPGTPKVQTQSLNDPDGGKLDLTWYVLMGSGSFYTLEDMTVEKPEGLANPKKVLVDLQGGFLSTSGTTLVSSQDTMFKGYVARTMMFKRDSKMVRGLSFIAGNHVLAFFGTADATQMKSPIITNFFDSIKVNGK